MKFGLFYLPTYVPQARDVATHFDNIVEQVLFADQIGIDYAWMVEHHFVRHGGLCAGNFAFLAYLAGKTRRIRLGTGATVLPLNDPVRVAEQAATLDQLSKGRFDLGIGRGFLRDEFDIFGVDMRESRERVEDGIELVKRAWTEPVLNFKSRFRPPIENISVLPRIYQTPHPPIWVACSSPATFIEAGELGLGALCFTFGTPSEIAEHVRNYKQAIQRCTRPIGAYVNDNIAVTTNMFCLPDGDEARHLYSLAKVEKFTEYFFSWLDSIPRPKGLPPSGPITGIPAATPAELKKGLEVGGRQVGAPEEIAKVIQMYEAIGVDQLIYAPLTLTMDQKYVLKSIETFGRHVLPKFDRDPVHSTTRQREAALAAAA